MECNLVVGFIHDFSAGSNMSETITISSLNCTPHSGLALVILIRRH